MRVQRLLLLRHGNRLPEVLDRDVVLDDHPRRIAATPPAPAHHVGASRRLVAELLCGSEPARWCRPIEFLMTRTVHKERRWFKIAATSPLAGLANRSLLRSFSRSARASEVRSPRWGLAAAGVLAAAIAGFQPGRWPASAPSRGAAIGVTGGLTPPGWRDGLIMRGPPTSTANGSSAQVPVTIA